MTINDWILGIALVFIIEGFIPFVAPKRWLEAMHDLTEKASPETIRRFGLFLLLAGVAIIWTVTL